MKNRVTIISDDKSITVKIPNEISEPHRKKLISGLRTAIKELQNFNKKRIGIL